MCAPLNVVAGDTCCAQSGGTCCAQCGCEGPVTKICHRVEDKRKITVTCWGMETEPVCVPGPSTPDCKHCEDVCESDGCCLHGCPRSLVWTDWIPGHRAKMYTHTRLMKKTVTKTVPAYKWVVEDLCPDCRAKAK